MNARPLPIWMLFLVIAALAGAYVATAPQPADAHEITRPQCRTYSKARAVVVNPQRPGARRQYVRSCVRAARAHARAHCTYTVRAAIKCAFGPTWHYDAIAVATCESSLDPWILGPNDEHGNARQGLFQFGTSERETWGPYVLGDAVSQSRAAARYFRNSGYDWSPWSECAP